MGPQRLHGRHLQPKPLTRLHEALAGSHQQLSKFGGPEAYPKRECRSGLLTPLLRFPTCTVTPQAALGAPIP